MGFALPRKLTHLEKPLKEWLDKGYHAGMSWMENHVEERLDPTRLFPGAQSLISLIAWYHAESYVEGCGISRYAVGRDYHKVLKKKGKELIAFIGELAGTVRARVFTDSAPVMEREWARQAGLGWIGKNGCLITPRKGSWFFLSEILLDIPLEPDSPETADLCGSCTRCIRACPTQALLGNGQVDANRCISYLTIELKDKLECTAGLTWDDWIFGCDICQEVCPWNRQPLNYQFPDFTPRPEVMQIRSELGKQSLSPEALQSTIQGTALIRAGAAGLIRNFNRIHPASGQKDAEQTDQTG